jgi:hypothetical protein
MQNIDKITIAVVALLLVAGFGYPFMISDPGSEYSSKISEANNKIEENMASQNLGDQSVPEVLEKVRMAYDVPGGAAIPEWAFYRKPARLAVKERIILVPPTLDAAYIASVKVVRDASDQSTYHEISGRHALYTNAEITSCVVEMQEGDSDWTKLQQVDGFSSGQAFAIQSGPLESGRSYRYRIATKAAALPGNMAFPRDGSNSVVSGETGVVLMPANEAWKVSGAQVGRLDSSGNFMPGRATIQYSRWDWDAGSSKKSAKVVTEPKAGAQADELFGTGFRLERIQDTGDGRVVVLRNESGKRSYLKNNDDPQSLDPNGWDNFDGDPAESGGDEDEADSADNSAAEEVEVEKPKRTRPTGGGLFGGDD